jgi:sugar phosphate isomerase/epimerase
MKPQKLAALIPLLAIEPLSLDIRGTAQTAQKLGYGGLAIGVNHPEINTKTFGPTAQRHFKQVLAVHGLALGAIRVGVGKAGAFDPATCQKLLDDALSACDLAHRLQTPLVSVYIGEPADDQSIPGEVAEIVRLLAVRADRTGVITALSCGQSTWLHKLLSSIDAPCLAANLDSARVVAAGGSPPQAAEMLAGRLALWTCADAVRTGSAVHLTPLGSGRAAGQEVVNILKSQDYTGPIVVDVRDLPNPVQAAEQARNQLQQWIFA